MSHLQSVSRSVRRFALVPTISLMLLAGTLGAASASYVTLAQANTGPASYTSNGAVAGGTNPFPPTATPTPTATLVTSATPATSATPTTTSTPFTPATILFVPNIVDNVQPAPGDGNGW